MNYHDQNTEGVVFLLAGSVCRDRRQDHRPLLRGELVPEMRGFHPGAGFEVVLVSCDEERPSFERFHRTMPWPAVPFGDLRCKKRLSERFQVEGIPRLVVLAPDGAVVHPDAADLVHRYGERAFPFTAARVAELEADDQRKYASQTLEMPSGRRRVCRRARRRARWRVGACAAG